MNFTFFRYREFRQLHSNIKFIYKGKLPKFPEKNFFSNMSQRTIQERFFLLNKYLNFISKQKKLLNLSCVKFFLMENEIESQK